MKLFFVILLCANVLFAQTPITTPTSTQAIPVLQEWWRADNMGYGINGMTWLDNFYNGKGALVISTPNGVQTWQLRCPWDTVNVFTWSGGDANIKTGDFNGDGVTDYVDDKGNIYIGIENGKPPLPSDTKINHQIGQRRVLVADVNKDGKSDILSFASTMYPSKIFGQIFFGTTDVKNILSKSVYQSGTIDTNSSAYCIYENSKKEIRLINRYYQKGSSDGYTLYSVSINNIDSTPVLNKLHEYFVSDRQETCGRTNALITDDTKHTIHWVALEMINERRELTNVTVYDITNDTFNKLYSVRMDSVTTIGSFNNSIDNNGTKDFYIVRWKVDLLSKLMLFSGEMFSSFNQLSEYKLCQYQGCTTVNDLNQDGIADIVTRGEYFDDNCFRIVLSDKTSSAIEVIPQVSSFSTRFLSSIPVNSKQDIHLEFKSELSQNIDIDITDILGRIVFRRKIIIPNDTSNVLLQTSLLSLNIGKYFIQCSSLDGKQVLPFNIVE
ncbi:MAG: VCBS repeat-containing protein [Candidatus Kapabacteria bacterium]|nr:VCBS repeat-containing protein [Candidatus Kapabacteria bacterium]